MSAESTTLVESIPALAVAVGLAALIAAWAEEHFNEGQRLGEIRYSVPQQRYFAALAVHVTVILGLYVLFLVTVYGAIALASGSVPQFDCYGFELSDECKRSFRDMQALDSDALLWSALASGLFLRLVIPNVAMTWRFLDRLREQTHELALFPFARQTLLAALSASKFADGEDSGVELRNQLNRYGVDWKLMSFVSPSAKRSLMEVCSLRQRLTDLLQPLQGFAQVLRPQKPCLDSRLLAGSLRPTEEIEFSSSQRLRKFGATRAMAFGELETDFRRIMRRTALALLLAEEISEKIESEALYRAISNFVAEECDDVLSFSRRRGRALLRAPSRGAEPIPQVLRLRRAHTSRIAALPLGNRLRPGFPPVLNTVAGYAVSGRREPRFENRATRAVRRSSRALANGRAYLGHLSKDRFELRTAIALFLAAAIVRRLRSSVIHDGCYHSLFIPARLPDSIPDRAPDISQLAWLSAYDRRNQLSDRPPIAVGLTRFRAGPDRRWIDLGRAYGKWHADVPTRHLLPRSRARLVRPWPSAALPADPSPLPRAFGGAGLRHGLFCPVRDRSVHAEGASPAAA